jgi:hypothetical protein
MILLHNINSLFLNLYYSAFKSSVGFLKPLEEIAGLESSKPDEDNEVEKKYDKVLNHIRLSNDGYKPHEETYYEKKILALAEQNKVN